MKQCYNSVACTSSSCSGYQSWTVPPMHPQMTQEEHEPDPSTATPVWLFLQVIVSSSFKCLCEALSVLGVGYRKEDFFLRIVI